MMKHQYWIGLLSLVAIFLFSITGASAERMWPEFKAFSFGSSYSSVKQRIIAQYKRVGIWNNMICAPDSSFAGFNNVSVSLNFKKNRLVSYEISKIDSGTDFEERLKDRYSIKYGPPTEIGRYSIYHGTLRSHSTEEGNTYTWNLPDKTIKLYTARTHSNVIVKHLVITSKLYQ